MQINRSQPSSQDSFDVLFVGAGVSTLYTVLALTARLSARAVPGVRRPRIAIVERSTDFLGGVPYTSRSAYTSLLITSLRHFLPEGERALFVEWLEKNKHWMFQTYQRHGGSISARWLQTHQETIRAGAWEDLYLPRYLFGLYMDARVRQAISQAESTGTCTVELVRGQVADVARGEDGFEIDLEGRRLQAGLVVVAVGSPPASPKLARPPETDDDAVCLIEEPYGPDLGTSLDRIDACILRAGDPSPKVLFVGAGASTMDLLYALQDRWHDARPKVRFRVLSPNGRLPDRMPDQMPGQADSLSFHPPALEELSGRDTLTAKQIHDAAAEDVEFGQTRAFTSAVTLAPISAAVGMLLARLSPAEQREFAVTWGNAIGRLQRRAGPEYCDVADELMVEGRLGLTQGRFRGIRSITADGAEVEYESGGRLHCLARRPRVIVNCAGFARIGELSANHLLQRLVAQGFAQPTSAGTGFVVDDCLQASEGVFIVGPLLAGNIFAGKPLWHLEHCGRISALAVTLAEILASRLTREPSRQAADGVRSMMSWSMVPVDGSR